MNDRFRGGRQQEPPLPKPYDFVPLPDGLIPAKEPAGHHRYHKGNLTGSLNAQIVARSSVHVASGILEQVRDPRYPLIKGHFRTGGVIAIPATSLKGCIRSILEAISRSTVQVTRSRDYQPTSRTSRDRVDVAQNIFGTLGYQGLVRFSDALLIEGQAITVTTPQLFRPRSESVDTYFDGNRPRGRKFYMHGARAEGNLPLEACEPGSRFGLRLEFANLTPAELGLLLTAMGLGEPKWWPKLGGAKPACLGTIEIIEPTLTAYDLQASYSDFDAAPQPLAFAPLLEAARSLILEQPARKLAEILRWPREDRACPERNY